VTAASVSAGTDVLRHVTVMTLVERLSNGRRIVVVTTTYQKVSK